MHLKMNFYAFFFLTATQEIRKGLLKAAKTTGAWIFTGGTNTGKVIFNNAICILHPMYSEMNVIPN